MIKNRLEPKKGKDIYGDPIELNNIVLKYDSDSYTLKPGESIDVMKHFSVTKEFAPLLEARFLQKFHGALRLIDTAAEEAKIEGERVEKQKVKVSAAKSVKEVKEVLKNEKNQEVINLGMDKLEELASKPAK